MLYNNNMTATVGVGVGVCDVEIMYDLIPLSPTLELSSEVRARCPFVSLTNEVCALNESNKMTCYVQVSRVVESQVDTPMSILYIDAEAFIDIVIQAEEAQLYLAGVGVKVFDGENMRLVKKVTAPTVVVETVKKTEGAVAMTKKTTGKTSTKQILKGVY